VILVLPTKLHYGDFGGNQNETLYLRDQRSSSLIPLKHLSLFRQQIDCNGLDLTILQSLEQLELYQTNLMYCNMRKLLRMTPNVKNLFADYFTFKYNLVVNVSISDFPLNLRYLYFVVSSGNLVFSGGPAPRFASMEVLGLRVRQHSSALNEYGDLNKVFPKLKFCFLGIEELAVIEGILKINTLEKLLVVGVREFKNSKVSNVSLVSL
jgi:hypothetical protein